MKPFNVSAEESLLLTENSYINENWTYTVNDVATDISGGSFKWNLLNKKGGSIIDAMTVAYTTDGTDGGITWTFTIAELAAILSAYDAGTGSLPAYHELFFSEDATDAKYKIWVHGPVEVARSGS